MTNQEQNQCSICHEVKIVGRLYLYALNKDKILEKYKNANYFVIIWYCQDCGEPYLPELMEQI